jgi:hypothetical protein
MAHFIYSGNNESMGARDLIWLLTRKIPRQIWIRTREIVREKTPAFFQARRRLALLGLGGAALVLVLGFIVAALLRGHARVVRARAVAGELTESFAPLPIAPEDFFLPEEPDALPEFIPFRPRREAWTAADAAEYWTDPLEEKETLWRNRFGAMAEELLEAVP